MSDVLGLFLDCYDPFVQPAVHTFSYAEVVANNMKEVFQRASGPAQRAKALELAVHAAIWANRFAAMDTCRDMVMSVEANDLGLPVATLVSQNKDSFLDHIEPAIFGRHIGIWGCSCFGAVSFSVRPIVTLRQLKQSKRQSCCEAPV